jgi:biotin carboxyl carrier protein
MRQYNLTISGNDYNVIIKEVTTEDVLAEVNGVEHRVLIRKINKLAQASKPAAPIQPVQPVTTPTTSSQTSAPASPSSAPTPAQTATPVGDGTVISPIPGHVLEISVNVGDKVLKGQKVLVLEAMKLENVITATTDGTIQKILVNEGDAVNHHQELMIIE